MQAPRVRRRSLHPHPHRAGLLAATEITAVVAVLAILYWGSCLLVSPPDSELAASEALSRASSFRPVYRISMEETGNRLWVFRPLQEVTGVNLTSGQVDKSRHLPGLSPRMVAHSRDGATSLMVTEDNSVCLVHEGSDPVWEESPLEGAELVDVAVSHDGSVALFALSDGTIRGWNVIDARAELFEYRLPMRRALLRMCLDGDGLRMFAAFRDGSTSLHDARNGRLLCDLPSTGSECTAAAWSDDGRRVAVASANGSVGLIDAESGEHVWRTTLDFRVELIRVTALAISPDGRWIAAGGLSTRCFIWDSTASDVVRKLSGHAGLVRAVAFSPHAKSLFTGGLDGTIREWSLDSFTTLRTLE